MNRSEGQYHLTHVYDEVLLPGEKQTGNSKSAARKKSSSDGSSR